MSKPERTRRASGKFVWIVLVAVQPPRNRTYATHDRLSTYVHTCTYVCVRTPCCRVVVTRGRSRLCQGPFAYILIDKATQVACVLHCRMPEVGRLSSSSTLQVLLCFSSRRIVSPLALGPPLLSPGYSGTKIWRRLAKGWVWMSVSQHLLLDQTGVNKPWKFRVLFVLSAKCEHHNLLLINDWRRRSIFLSTFWTGKIERLLFTLNDRPL